MKMTGVLEQGWNYILWEGGSPEAGLYIFDLEEQEKDKPSYIYHTVSKFGSITKPSVSLLLIHL